MHAISVTDILYVIIILLSKIDMYTNLILIQNCIIYSRQFSQNHYSSYIFTVGALRRPFIVHKRLLP